MHQSLVLLAEAKALLEQEMQACEAEDIESMEACATQREAKMLAAWDGRYGCDEALLHKELCSIEQTQTQLIAKAEALHARLGEYLRQNKKQSGYFADSKHRVQQADKAYFCNTVS